MSDSPASLPVPEMDAAKLEEIADYLGLTQEALERLQLLRDEVAGLREELRTSRLRLAA